MRRHSVYSGFREDRHVVLHHGDTYQFLKTIPPGEIQLIVSSPPYNLGKQYETRVELQSYLKSQAPVIDQLVRVLSDNGSLCWQVGNYVCNGEVYPLDIFYYDFFKERGLKLRNRVIWHFEHGLHASRRLSGRYETLLWFTKSDDYIFNLDPIRVKSKYPGKRHYKGPKKGTPSGNPLGKNPSDFWKTLQSDWESLVWEIPNVKANHPEKTIHPCQFPVELVERCVLAMTKEDGWVLDPYAGVGSALVAGLRHDRRVAGCDKEEAYVQLARKRITSLREGSLRVRPLGKPVHQPSSTDKIAQRPNEWNQAQSALSLSVQE